MRKYAAMTDPFAQTLISGRASSPSRLDGDSAFMPAPPHAAPVDTKAHWERVHEENADEDVSWHQASPEPSLRLVRACAPPPEASVLDVGGGISRLVDALLDAGYRDVGVLDLSGAALQRSRERLGKRAESVAWFEADVTRFETPRRYDVWHDRAVLHFLTRPEDQQAYVRALERALAPGGHVVLGTFAPEGPEQCSGLPVARHDAASLAALLGDGFALVETFHHMHTTPWGTLQAFTWARLRRVASSA